MFFVFEISLRKIISSRQRDNSNFCLFDRRDKERIVKDNLNLLLVLLLLLLLLVIAIFNLTEFCAASLTIARLSENN